MKEIKNKTKKTYEKARGKLKYHHVKNYKEKSDHWVKCARKDK